MVPPQTMKKWDTLNARIDKIVARAEREGTLGEPGREVRSALTPSDMLLGGHGRIGAKRH